MAKQPLAEVFGFPIDNFSQEAQLFRANQLCPFNNRVPNCTKDKANDPLGVCSVYEDDNVVITCPIRFRQNWLIAADASAFFFPTNTRWTSLTEIRLNDRYGHSAGNIDIVLVSYDERGHLTDFGALEVQAVYISGNVRRPFEFYVQDPEQRVDMDWTGRKDYPRPDYLSSSRKRLAPQLIFKGGILHTWRKKQAVALHRVFFDTLPPLPNAEPGEADLVWLIYDLKLDPAQKRYQLTLVQTVYTSFGPALEKIIRPEAGPIENFVDYLQERLDEKLDNGNPPDAPILTDIVDM